MSSSFLPTPWKILPEVRLGITEAISQGKELQKSSKPDVDPSISFHKKKNIWIFE